MGRGDQLPPGEGEPEVSVTYTVFKLGPTAQLHQLHTAQGRVRHRAHCSPLALRAARCLLLAPHPRQRRAAACSGRLCTPPHNVRTHQHAGVHRRRGRGVAVCALADRVSAGACHCMRRRTVVPRCCTLLPAARRTPLPRPTPPYTPPSLHLTSHCPPHNLQELRQGKYPRLLLTDPAALRTVAALGLPVEASAGAAGAAALPPGAVQQLMIDRRRLDLLQPFKLALLKLASQEVGARRSGPLHACECDP